jgi:hypothetical protein
MINIIKILFEHFLNSFHTSRVLTKDFKIYKFINIFFIRFFFSIPLFRNLLKHSTESIGSVQEQNFFTKNIDTNLIAENIKKKGYHDDLSLNNKTLEKIFEEFKKKNFFFDSKNNQEIFLYNNKNSSFEDILNKSFECKIPLITLNFILKKDSILKKIATSSIFYTIAKNYLKSEKLTINTHCFISHPLEVNEQEKKNNAQYFHYDCDYRKFLKIFVYLTDVDRNSGPHCFVENTHIKKKFKHILAKRIDDNEILNSYPAKDYREFIKPKGSIIFEDTFGLHKGSFPKKESRAILIFEYGIGKRIQYVGNEFLTNQ